MDYKRVRQATDILAVLEQGDFAADVTKENDKLLEALSDLAPPKGKAVKGEQTLKIGYSLVGNQMEISASISAKSPKAVRGTTHLWLNPDHTLNTEHPKQTAMEFNDPNVSSIRSRAAE